MTETPAPPSREETMELPQDRALREIRGERAYQDCKWGTLAEHGHEPLAWIAIVRNRLDKAEAAMFDKHAGRMTYRKEMVTVAAVAVAALEQLYETSFPALIAAGDAGDG